MTNDNWCEGCNPENCKGCSNTKEGRLDLIAEGEHNKILSEINNPKSAIERGDEFLERYDSDDADTGNIRLVDADLIRDLIADLGEAKSIISIAVLENERLQGGLTTITAERLMLKAAISAFCHNAYMTHPASDALVVPTVHIDKLLAALKALTKE